MTTKTTDMKAIRKRWNQLRKETQVLDERYDVKGWGHMFSAKRGSATVRVADASAYLAHDEVKRFIEDMGCTVETGEGDYGLVVRFVF